MTPEIFKDPQELRDYIQSLPIPPEIRSSSVMTHKGELTVSQILVRLDMAIENTFEFKKMLAKWEGGLGNTKAVRKLSEIHSDSATVEITAQFEEEIDRQNSVISEILESEGGLGGIFMKAVNFLRGRSVEKSQKAKADAAIVMVKSSVDSLLTRLMGQNEELVVRLQDLKSKVAKAPNPEEALAEIDEKIEKNRLLCEVVKDYALFQVSLNEAMIRNIFR